MSFNIVPLIGPVIAVRTAEWLLSSVSLDVSIQMRLLITFIRTVQTGECLRLFSRHSMGVCIGVSRIAELRNRILLRV